MQRRNVAIGTSFQIAVLFSYDFIIQMTRNVQDFYTMMINYSKELRKNQWKDQEYVNYVSKKEKDPPYLILFKLMSSYGTFNGFDIGHFVGCFVRLYNNCHRIKSRSRYDYSYKKRDIYCLMQSFKMNKEFDRIQNVIDTEADWLNMMETKPVIPKEKQSILSSTTIKELLLVRCANLPAASKMQGETKHLQNK